MSKTDWTSVSNSVIDFINIAIDKSVKKYVQDSVWNSTRNSIWDSIDNSIWDSIHDFLWDEILEFKVTKKQMLKSIKSYYE